MKEKIKRFSSREAVEQELELEEIVDPNDWREVYGNEDIIKESRLVDEKTELEDWQKALNDAFKAGDYEAIQTMKRARPNMSVSPGLIKKRLNELVITRPKKWDSSYSLIKDVFNLRADSNCLEKVTVELLEQCGKTKGACLSLQEFIEVTNYKVPSEIVQSKYASIFKNGAGYDFKKEEILHEIKSYTNIGLDSSVIDDYIISGGDIRKAKRLSTSLGVKLSSAQIQKAYEIYFSKYRHFWIDEIKEIGEIPNAELIQKAYVNIIKKHSNWKSGIDQLYELTSIEPNLKIEEISPTLEELLSHPQGYDSAVEICKLTGSEIPNDLIQKAAIQYLNKDSRNQFSYLKDDLQRLQKLTAHEIKIPESIIHDFYNQAIIDIDPHTVINLHDTFNIKPNIDKKTSKNFIVSCTLEYYSSSVKKLETIFNMDTSLTETEAKEWYEELIKNLIIKEDTLYKFNKIKELSGLDCDKEKIRDGYLKFLESRLKLNPSSRLKNELEARWIELNQNFLKHFEITISNEEIIEIYTNLIDSEVFYTRNLHQLKQITRLEPPENLVQKAYQKSFPSNFDNIVGIYDLSGVKPSIPNDIIQQAYQLLIKWFLESEKIAKLRQITQIDPVFNTNQIKEIYIHLCSVGLVDKLKDAQEATGVEFVLDSETKEKIVQKIENEILSATMDNRYSYISDELMKAKNLIENTGLLPSAQKLQTCYSNLLKQDSWQKNISILEKVTTIGPKFSPAELQTKSEELLGQNLYPDLKELKQFGEINLPLELIYSKYEDVLTSSRVNDEKKKLLIYKKDWFSQIITIKEGLDIAPSDAQQIEIFIMLVSDENFKDKKMSKIDLSLNIMKEHFNFEISGENIQKIYSKLFNEPKFGDKDGVSFSILKHIYNLTKAKPELSERQKEDAFNSINSSILAIFYELLEIVGEASEKSVIAKLLDLLSYHRFGDGFSIADFKRFADKFNIDSIPVEVVNSATEAQINNLLSPNTYRNISLSIFLQNISAISSLTNISASLSPEKFSSLLLPKIKKISDTRDFKSIIDIIQWFEESTKSKIEKSLIDEVYLNSFDKSLSIDNSYMKIWQYLKQQYGSPSNEIIQRTYFNNFSVDSIKEISDFTKIKPDLTKLYSIDASTNVEVEKSNIYDRLTNLFNDQIKNLNIDNILFLESQFKTKCFIDESKVQPLYTDILFNEIDQIDEAEKRFLKFIFERTQIKPAKDIIDARYRELFKTRVFDLDDLISFNELVDLPPSYELVQEKYRELFTGYIQTHEYNNGNYDDEEPWVDNGEKFFADYSRLKEYTGLEPNFDKDYALGLYTLCIHNDRLHTKINDISAETKIPIDESFIQQNILNNPDFSAPLNLSISKSILNKHFSDLSNRNVDEYARIYKIFGCFSYYNDALKKLEKSSSIEAKQQIIAIRSAMALRDMSNEEYYSDTKEKLMLYVAEENTSINKTLAEALAALAREGDEDLLSYLASTLDEVTIKEENKNSFSPIQEVALRTLFQMNNPIANERLFTLLFEGNLDGRLKRLILQNLVTKKKVFFPRGMNNWIKSKLDDKTKAFPWEDLKYFRASNQIPNLDLRAKTIRYLDDSFALFKESQSTPSQLQKTICPSVPNDAFLPLVKFTGADNKLLNKFNNLYKINCSSTIKSDLLFGIVNTFGANYKILEKIVSILKEIEMNTVNDIVNLGKLFKTINFLVYTIDIQDGYEKTEKSILGILNQSFESLDILAKALENFAAKKLQEVLPNKGIKSENILSLLKEWGNLDPIFIYASKMSQSGHRGNLKLVAEMVANMDAPKYEGWKNWRYNLKDSNVDKQVGLLDDSQLSIWKEDKFQEMGNIMIATTPSDKPQKIDKFIRFSLSENHIYSEQIPASFRHKFIHDRLATEYKLIEENPNQRETILSGAINLLQEDIKQIDTIIQFGDLGKLENSLAYFNTDNEVKINAVTKNNINTICKFLTTELSKELNEKYLTLQNNTEVKSIQTARLLDASIFTFLEEKIRAIKDKYELVLNSEIFNKLDLNKDDIKNLGQFYKKRQELKALMDLYHIGSLDMKKIATNRISNRGDKKGETITSLITSLKTYFKDNLAFVQDIENIDSVISKRVDLGLNRRLAMILTDNPQMLFQAGKYPKGCGSCQNYEGDPNWNKSLAAYVADAHIKVAYLIDLNKLPKEILDQIEINGFEKTKEFIPCQELLEASIARTVVKVTKESSSNKPTLFIEPTYSSINKGDLSMDKYFNIFLELMVSQPMNILLSRGGGNLTVKVPNSRNPNGQYEDCGAGNAGNAGMGIKQGTYSMPARLVNKFTPITKADIELSKRISGT